jgi:hypothetical protein
VTQDMVHWLALVNIAINFGVPTTLKILSSPFFFYFTILYIYFHVYALLETGFGLVIQFINHIQVV